METQNYYVTKIKEKLSLKQKQNPNYSLRAFSRDLNLHCSTLSQIIKGKRSLPLKRAVDVAKNLGLSPKEKTLFMESFYRSKTNIDEIEIPQLDERFMLDESYYQVISQWEHFAVLELFNLAEYDLSIRGIAKKLDISIMRTEVVVQNLLHCSLLIQTPEGDFERVHSDIKTTEDISSQALKESHRETLELGKRKLDEVELEFRDFSSSTLAVDLEKIPEAKTIIREFRQKMTSLLKNGKKTDVFQLAIQFYPLTKIRKKENLK